MLELKVWIGVEKKHPHHCPRQVQSPPSSSYFRLLRTLLRMRRTMAAVARHHFDLFTDNVFNDFEDFPGSSLPEESSNSSRGYSHFCRKEKRGSKEFQVVALSGGCVLLEARRWPGFHLFGPLHQYGCRFQLLPLTITYTVIMTTLQPSKACNLAILTSRCSQTLTPTDGVQNSQEPGCARIPGPAHARATPTERA